MRRHCCINTGCRINVAPWSGRRQKLSACRFRANAIHTAWVLIIRPGGWWCRSLPDVRARQRKSHLLVPISCNNFRPVWCAFSCGRIAVIVLIIGERLLGERLTKISWQRGRTQRGAHRCHARSTHGVNYARKQYYRRNYRTWGQTLAKPPLFVAPPQG